MIYKIICAVALAFWTLLGFVQALNALGVEPQVTLSHATVALACAISALHAIRSYREVS